MMLVHLQLVAGEPINIKGASLPVITVTITDNEASDIKGQLREKAPSILGLYMVVDSMAASVPVSGHYSISGRKLSFEPTYALGDGLEFEVVYKTGDKTNTRRFRTADRSLPDISTRVVTAYPTCDTIPYNTLFFHVRFSQPMMGDIQAYKHVQVYDDAGNERLNAWRQKSFWLDSGRLLVLMIHPGRVKNGIHYESPLFDSGRYYKLVVDKDIKDANDNPLVDRYEQRFFVKGEDRISPVPGIDKGRLPAAGTIMPLRLSFSEGMDYASVLDGVKLCDDMGATVPCKIESEPGNRYFTLLPHRQWKKGSYSLVLKGAVYDFAANRVSRLFEMTDEQEIEKGKMDTKLPFRIN